MKKAAKRNLVVTRIYPASVKEVWAAWTRPAQVKRWWGPDRFSCPSAVIDFKEGGRALVSMRPPKEFGGGDYFNVWVFSKIDPLKSFEFVQNLTNSKGQLIDPKEAGMPADFPKDMRCLVSLKSLPSGRTKMTVTEFDWSEGALLQLAELGLNQCMDKLGACLPKT